MITIKIKRHDVLLIHATLVYKIPLFCLPTRIPDSLSVEQMLELMKVDKKVQQGRVRLVLMQELGNSVLTDDYSAELLHQTLQAGYTV